METWRSICKTLSAMKDLHELRLHISQTYFFVEPRDASLEAEYVVGILEPLKEVHVVNGERGAFEVTIGWKLTEEEREMLGKVPFTIVEAGERGYAGMSASSGNPYAVQVVCSYPAPPHSWTIPQASESLPREES